MINLTAQQISGATGAKLVIAQSWTKAINDALADFDINTSARQAAFLAQIGYESSGLSAVVENLNYKASQLLITFKGRFTSISASQYEHKPELIANHVYASRNGNGNEASGDGWKYRGRGPIQLTGLTNYLNAKNRLKLIYGDSVPDFVLSPDSIELPEWGSACAGMYWKTNGCNELADRGNIDAITHAINGPAMEGAQKRRDLWAKAKTTLGVK